MSLERVTFLVLDEADRMLECGFEEQVGRIGKTVRSDRQTLFFLATWPTQVQHMAQLMCSSDLPPVRILAGQRADGEGPTSREDILQEVASTKAFAHRPPGPEPPTARRRAASRASGLSRPDSLLELSERVRQRHLSPFRQPSDATGETKHGNFAEAVAELRAETGLRPKSAEDSKPGERPATHTGVLRGIFDPREKEEEPQVFSVVRFTINKIRGSGDPGNFQLHSVVLLNRKRPLFRLA